MQSIIQENDGRIAIGTDAATCTAALTVDNGPNDAIDVRGGRIRNVPSAQNDDEPVNLAQVTAAYTPPAWTVLDLQTPIPGIIPIYNMDFSAYTGVAGVIDGLAAGMNILDHVLGTIDFSSACTLVPGDNVTTGPWNAGIYQATSTLAASAIDPSWLLNGLPDGVVANEYYYLSPYNLSGQCYVSPSYSLDTVDITVAPPAANGAMTGGLYTVARSGYFKTHIGGEGATDGWYADQQYAQAGTLFYYEPGDGMVIGVMYNQPAATLLPGGYIQSNTWSNLSSVFNDTSDGFLGAAKTTAGGSLPMIGGDVWQLSLDDSTLNYVGNYSFTTPDSFPAAQMYSTLQWAFDQGSILANGKAGATIANGGQVRYKIVDSDMIIECRLLHINCNQADYDYLYIPELNNMQGLNVPGYDYSGTVFGGAAERINSCISFYAYQYGSTPAVYQPLNSYFNASGSLGIAVDVFGTAIYSMTPNV